MLFCVIFSTLSKGAPPLLLRCNKQSRTLPSLFPPLFSAARRAAKSRELAPGSLDIRARRRRHGVRHSPRAEFQLPFILSYSIKLRAFEFKKQPAASPFFSSPRRLRRVLRFRSVQPSTRVRLDAFLSPYFPSLHVMLSIFPLVLNLSDVSLLRWSMLRAGIVQQRERERVR